MRKQFTVEQANNALPLVRRIVEDVVAQYRRWQDRVREFELVSMRSTADRPDPRAEELERDVQALAAEIAGFEAELDELGVEMKGYDMGLVDFPTEVGGRPAYLCWRLGEPSVQFWHDLDAGYAGRQPIAPRAVA
jgi:hypothetical protein